MFFVMSANENTVLSKIKEDLSDQVDVLEEENQNLNSQNQDLLKENQRLAMSLFEIDDFGENLGESDEKFIKFLKEQNLLDSVNIVPSEEGLLIRFKDNILFDSGEADVTNRGYDVLKQIGEKLKTLDNDIRIEGYTDNIPMNTIRFPSNWELSASRAISVVKYFIEDIGIKEERLSFSGWGERKPIADNSTAEGRSQNRRIEITILNREK
jgi:chemotaxis protein MotB